MQGEIMALEALIAGFFAIALIRARSASPVRGKLRARDLFRLSPRLERLRRSRWQWVSMVALMLVLRLQGQLPLGIEAAALLQFLIFLALPVAAEQPAGARKR